ncbi:phasin-related domain-containing protein [Ferrimonas pelagia]|uniref:Poly(Hydroxyalkanoate) granule-associated protein n=1 Tax=Ferrimonas pelagia TaxID=1177826 RepID=A0ABP9FB70_9GAMM
MSNHEFNTRAEQEEAMARKIWLAGLGAYAKGTKELNQLSNKSRSWLDELVERGREMEHQTKNRLKDAQEQTQVAVEQQLNSRMQRITGLDPRQLDELDAKLDQLTAVVEQLAQAKAEPVEAKAPEVKKPAVRRTRKVAEKES